MMLTGGPKLLIEKLARAPNGFASSTDGSRIARKAYEKVQAEDPEQAEAFFVELVMLGFHPELTE